MVHGPATEWKTDKSEAYKSKLGLIMFAIYTTLYLFFIVICVLSPKSVGINVGPLNLAIAYGFGIIVLAIIQALVYNNMCTKREKLEELAAKRSKEIAK